MDVVRRRTQYDLRKAREREHILLGYRIALDYIDDVIKIIRSPPAARTPAKICTNSSRTSLCAFPSPARKRPSAASASTPRNTASPSPARAKGLGLSYIQIDAILELQLHRLTQLSADEILKELAEIRGRIAEF